MIPDRAGLEVEDLLKLVLILVVVYLVVNIALRVLEFALAPFGFLSDVLGLVVVVLIIAWLLDYI